MFFHAEITEISACATCNPPIVLRNLTSSLANSQLLVSREASKRSSVYEAGQLGLSWADDQRAHIEEQIRIHAPDPDHVFC